MEFMLGPEYRRPFAHRAVICFVVGVLLCGLGGAGGAFIAVLPGVIMLIVAAVAGTRWYGRLVFATRVSAAGVEIRGYFPRRVPWSEIKDIQVYDFARVGRVAVRNGPSGRGRSSGGGTKKEVVVKIIRTSGRTLELHAPLVTRDVGDSEFDDKVAALRSAWAASTAAAAGAAAPR